MCVKHDLAQHECAKIDGNNLRGLNSFFILKIRCNSFQWYMVFVQAVNIEECVTNEGLNLLIQMQS